MKKNLRLFPAGFMTTLAVTLPLAANAQLSVPPHMQQRHYDESHTMAAKAVPVESAPVAQMPQMPQQPEAMMQPSAAAQTMQQTIPVTMLPQSMTQNCNMMQLKISNGITYMTGGTVQEEINQFSAMDAEFNLQLLFAAKNNDHLIVYRLRLLDSKGFELLATQVAGPYFYAHIPSGTYQLEITHEMGAMPVFVKMNIPANGRVRKTILLQ